MLVSEKIGPYTIVDRRQEGMSVLCLATAEDGRRVLVRLLPLGDIGEGARARVLGELEAIALLRHRNLVEVLEVVDTPDGPALVTEVLDGEALDAAASLKPLDLRTALDVGAQVCAGLQFAHTFGLTHGHLEADQVCLTPQGTAKILNLGLALVERIAANPACEPTDLDRANDEARLADLRAVGGVLYRMLTGHIALPPPSLSASLFAHEWARRSGGHAADDLAEALAHLVDLLLDAQRDPRVRVADAAALGRALTAARLALDEPAPAAIEEAAVTQEQPREERAAVDLAAGTEVRGVPTLTGPAELGTGVVPLPPEPPRERRARDMTVWAAIGAVAVLAGAAGVWFMPRSPGRGQSPPPPATWTLSLDSDPQGATVFVDGKPAAQLTPLDLTLPADRDPVVEVRLKDYRPRSVPLSGTVRLNGRVRVTLEPVPPPPGEQKVPVVARGGYAFELLQNGTVVSPMAREHTLVVRAGESIEVRSADHYLDRSYRVPEEGLSISVPPLARVMVQAAAYEDCVITVGSQITGSYPGGDPLLLPVGSYQFGLRCGDGRRPRVKTATIRAVPLNRVDFAKEEQP